MTKAFTRRTVLLWLVPFFAIILIANAWFVTVSMRTFHGEDQQRPYQQGLQYNDVLSARAQQVAAGWKAILEVKTGPVGLRLRLSVKDADGAPIERLRLAGVLRHPTDTSLDRSFDLKQIDDGLYEAQIPNPGRGRRDAVIRNQVGVPFETERRIWLP
jgi:nitrogen fixation protein FixH